MDVTALPGLGITGTLAIAIGYLLVADHRDHTAHQRAMQQRDSGHAAELAACAAYDADLAGLSSRVSPLERRLGEWEAELDRDRRCAAEDDAPAARRTR